MTRIESPALKAVESRNAVARIELYEKRLTESMIRFYRHGIVRMGGDPGIANDDETRSRLRRAVQRHVTLNQIE